MFRKPKKIQRRVFCADDEEDDNGEPEPPPPPIISQNKKESKSVKSSQLLSFADEEEDGEVFKVKKSSQSKRLAKRREKEKKKVTDGDNNKYDNNDDEGHLNNVEVNQTDKVKKKRVTLEGLILAGREALAADGTGDISDDSGKDEDDEDGEDERGFHRYRAETVRAALVPGHIPDAALIHAARKTRQQARELGGDYIPVRSEPTIGSRLMRDDGSADEDDDEGRIHVRGLDLPSDKPKRGTAAAPTDAELDSEVDEWEEQQMQKAMPAIVDITGDSSVETNPFAVAPPPPRLQDAPAHLRPLSATPLATADDLRAALAVRVGELKLERDATAQRRTEMRSRALIAERTLESRDARRGTLDAEYRRAQAVRGYLTDLVECLDEKMPELEALEARALALHRRRCEFVVERRRADVTDQAHDLLASANRGGGAGRAGEPSDEAKRRRAAEREGRRRARRLRREAAAAGTGAPTRHRDGDSSDDELPPADHHHHQQERESIRAAAANLFADALPAWRGVRGVCARLSRWRRRAPALYVDAYLPQCLPKLIAPYVRHQLILWNPLADEDNEDYERMDWYKCLMMYGVRSERIEDESEESEEEERNGEANVTESSIREDLDLFLVPTIINRVVLPKVSEIVECAWDPLCVRSCVRLRALLVRAAALPACRPALVQLASHAAARLAAALAHDVFLPPLPHHVLEGAGGAFWRRCLGAGVRLLRAALALTAPPPALRADYIVLKLIDTLCTAAGAAPPALMAGAGAALADTLPRSGELRALALRRLARLATLSLDRLQTDNPLHLKALEQSRAILNEAKAADLI